MQNLLVLQQQVEGKIVGTTILELAQTQMVTIQANRGFLELLRLVLTFFVSCKALV